MPEPVSVTLNWLEVFWGAVGGCRRCIDAFQRNYTDAHGLSSKKDVSAWHLHIEGCLGEMAVAKALNVFYLPDTMSFGLPDVGTLHVRTRSKHDYELLIRSKDPHGIYVLVTGCTPTFVVRGWFRREDVQDIWLQTHGNRPAAWFIPQVRLESIHDLKPRKPKQTPHEPDDLMRGEGKAGFDKFRREHSSSVSKPIDF